ncbi:hypothetical protein PVAP13_3NG110601 [Panicum virgatum]|uniref:Uncharacterized protein n=1 Tax=Panicum virgatum TaxID=38727 RepID=A0A8T0U4K3_PANVG|nr:hypothetical protein PVAP13_3NG110601 [Panicum virgatum]
MDYNYYVLGQVLKLVARTEVIRLCIFKFRLTHESCSKFIWNNVKCHSVKDMLLRLYSLEA